jgi:hypothetical protein
VGLLSEPVEINDEGICIPIFFVPKTIRYSEIKSIRKVPFWKAFLEGLNPFRPPMYSTGGISRYVVLIETKKNRLIAVSPRDGDEFIRMVTNRLKNTN